MRIICYNSDGTNINQLHYVPISRTVLHLCCYKAGRCLTGLFCLLRIMASEKAKSFYRSEAWKKCRAAYKRSVGGLCERCLKKGFIVPGVIVHHKTYISIDNITDPEILTSFENLELLCRPCHEEEHGTLKRNRERQLDDARQQRYKIDLYGRVIIADDSPPLTTKS